MVRWTSAETLENGAMNGAILEIYIVLEHDGALNPIEIKKTSNPGTELTKVFGLLDNSSTPRSNGVVICMKPVLGAIDRNNFVKSACISA